MQAAKDGNFYLFGSQQTRFEANPEHVGSTKIPEGTTMLEFLKIMISGKKAEMDERGATAVEYGLLVALIAAVIVGTVFILGGKINDAFTSINSKI